MKNFFKKTAITSALIISTQIFNPNIFFDFNSVTYAAEKIQGIPGGGKGSNESAAIEDLKKSIIKRVLGGITNKSDDPNSPYQILLNRYSEFVKNVKISSKGKQGNIFFVTGHVQIFYDELQSELGKLVKEVHANDETRSVYVFVRLVGAQNENNAQAAENTILQRYMIQFRENKFVVENADEVINEISKTRSLNFEQFIEMVKKKSEENPEICTAVIGEITMTRLDQNADGFTAACDIDIRTLDCLNNFAVIDNYEGSDVIRLSDPMLVGKILLEKSAISSSKAIAEKLVVYWKNKPRVQV